MWLKMMRIHIGLKQFTYLGVLHAFMRKRTYLTWRGAESKHSLLDMQQRLFLVLKTYTDFSYQLSFGTHI